MNINICICMFVTALSLACVHGFSQSISKLDEKNGFKDIKLNSSQSEFFGQVELNTNLEGVYFYSGSCCDMVFDMEVGLIMLEFDELHKLKTISILVESTYAAKKDAMYLVDMFEGLFGKPTAFGSEEGSGKMHFTWIGETTYLILELKIPDFLTGSKWFEETGRWDFMLPMIIVGRTKDIPPEVFSDGF